MASLIYLLDGKYKHDIIDMPFVEEGKGYILSNRGNQYVNLLALGIDPVKLKAVIEDKIIAKPMLQPATLVIDNTPKDTEWQVKARVLYVPMFSENWLLSNADKITLIKSDMTTPNRNIKLQAIMDDRWGFFDQFAKFMKEDINNFVTDKFMTAFSPKEWRQMVKVTPEVLTYIFQPQTKTYYGQTLDQTYFFNVKFELPNKYFIGRGLCIVDYCLP